MDAIKAAAILPFIFSKAKVFVRIGTCNQRNYKEKSRNKYAKSKQQSMIVGCFYFKSLTNSLFNSWTHPQIRIINIPEMGDGNIH